MERDRQVLRLQDAHADEFSRAGIGSGRNRDADVKSRSPQFLQSHFHLPHRGRNAGQFHWIHAMRWIPAVMTIPPKPTPESASRSSSWPPTRYDRRIAVPALND